MDRNEHKSLKDAIRALGDRSDSGELAPPFQTWIDYLDFVTPSIEPPLPHPDPDQIFHPVPALESLHTIPPSRLKEIALTHLLMATPYLTAMMVYPWSTQEIKELMESYINIRSAIEHLESF